MQSKRRRERRYENSAKIAVFSLPQSRFTRQLPRQREPIVIFGFADSCVLTLMRQPLILYCFSLSQKRGSFSNVGVKIHSKKFCHCEAVKTAVAIRLASITDCFVSAFLAMTPQHLLHNLKKLRMNLKVHAQFFYIISLIISPASVKTMSGLSKDSASIFSSVSPLITRILTAPAFIPLLISV